jgi:hypothetical protein
MRTKAQTGESHSGSVGFFASTPNSSIRLHAASNSSTRPKSSRTSESQQPLARSCWRVRTRKLLRILQLGLQAHRALPHRFPISAIVEIAAAARTKTETNQPLRPSVIRPKGMPNSACNQRSALDIPVLLDTTYPRLKNIPLPPAEPAQAPDPAPHNPTQAPEASNPTPPPEATNPTAPNLHSAQNDGRISPDTDTRNRRENSADPLTTKNLRKDYADPLTDPNQSPCEVPRSMRVTIPNPSASLRISALSVPKVWVAPHSIQAHTGSP